MAKYYESKLTNFFGLSRRNPALEIKNPCGPYVKNDLTH
jgi:hypothetical protein